LAKQNEEYQALKTVRDALKTEYDALVTKDDEGTITEAELETLIEKEGEYFEIDANYNAAKALVEERQNVANEKAYNKATADYDKAKLRLAEFTARDTEAKAAYEAITKNLTKL